MPDLFREIIPSILQTKKSVIKDEIDLKDYKPFMVNRALSYHMDCVLYANEMNMHAAIPKNWQFDFYREGIVKKKRFSKWHKRDQNSDQIALVIREYGYSAQKAAQALELLTEKQIKELQEKYKTGGR